MIISVINGMTNKAVEGELVMAIRQRRLQKAAKTRAGIPDERMDFTNRVRNR